MFLIGGRANMIEIVEGDLFSSKEKYLVHQTNCISKRSAHLAKSVFTRYPYADVYSNRINPDVPGTISIKGNGLDKRYVVSLFGQYYPGLPKYPASELDGTDVREKYFRKGLLAISKIKDLESVAFPYRIGCGAAGGDWNHYLFHIENFEKLVLKQNVKVLIYKLGDL
ncbi:hypothetical protein UFOVP1290_451 [uncultured Caudovirales phage]|uniref:Macro domain containing protein n=1 Tax=uncultured Caudovirales phage TaxID=2100421 RepID=A0A6J5RTP0_9CAUD|nr:hypothetical protein UFOVP1290_451 [uncultured Caudovirales phage]